MDIVIGVLTVLGVFFGSQFLIGYAIGLAMHYGFTYIAYAGRTLLLPINIVVTILLSMWILG